MKKIIAWISCLLVLCSTSCVNLLSHNDEGLWFYAYSNQDMLQGLDLTPASFLSLNPDKTYTLDFGEFDYGKWMKHGDTLTMHSVGGNTNNWIINSQTSKDLKLILAPGLISDFTTAPASYKDGTDNPFSLENNKWRIRATHKESAAEIKNRLINHCEFWKTYFLWATNYNIQYIDVRSTPTPIKIYGNGFALKEFGDLPETWRTYFVDSADCELANKMIENIFTHEDIAWANTDNKYKMFAGAFEQLINFLKKEKVQDISLH